MVQQLETEKVHPALSAALIDRLHLPEKREPELMVLHEAPQKGLV